MIQFKGVLSVLCVGQRQKSNNALDILFINNITNFTLYYLPNYNSLTFKILTNLFVQFQYVMNPFYKLNMPIKCGSFDKKVQFYGRKYLVN